MSMLVARDQEILLPVTTATIVTTVVIALLLNLVPWPEAIRPYRPDLCALILVYWGMHQPRRVGFGVAFLLGLAMDVADGSLFGQHALAYTVLVFAAIALHRRVLKFGLGGQFLHVLPLLVAADGVALLVRLVAGDPAPPATYLAGGLAAAALWIPLSALLRLARTPRADTGL